MFEKSLVMYQILLDPPKSPDKLGDFDSVSPLFKAGLFHSLKQVKRTWFLKRMTQKYIWVMLLQISPS
jgi:hypothetical protein